MKTMFKRGFARFGLGLGGVLLLWPQLAVSAMSEVTAETSGGSVIPAESEEIPEEILRTEIITGARSPLTGEPLSAYEYAQLQDELKEPAGGNLVSEDIRYLIFLLQVRRAIKPIVPFIP